MINLKILEAVNEVFKRLNNLRRWTAFFTEGRYDEISKQSLNCIISFFLATEAEKKGEKIQWERFPKIALYRAFQKAYVFYDTPEYICREICEMGGIYFEKEFSRATFEIITEQTGGDCSFSKWIEEATGTVEERIYKAATKIATLLELKENQEKINGEYLKQYDQILKSMMKYEDIPGFEVLSNLESSTFELFKIISKLRNQNRWAAYSYRVECSVLGHLFDTAIFAYLMAIEEDKSEEQATKAFFIGLFHDVPEAFTRDIPSPIKDRISGFRAATEQYEMYCMEKSFYPLMPSYMAEKVKSVMLELEDNEEYKTLIKGADYMSATSEIHRQFEDTGFLFAMRNHGNKFDSGKAKNSERGKELYVELLKDVEKNF